MDTIEELHTILKYNQITSVYQPILSLDTGDLFGYEALSRLSASSPIKNIEELFHLACSIHKVWDVEKLCRSKSLENAANKPSNTKLFLNVDPNIIHDSQFSVGFTNKKLKEYGLHTEDIIFEITERSSIESMEIFTSSIDHYRSQKFKIAIDDFGSGYSGLNRICAFSPDFLKIDMELVRGIDKDSVKRSIVAATIRFCKDLDIKVIAEGIETKDELKELIRLGADYGQGYFLAFPEINFTFPSESLKNIIRGLHNHPAASLNSSILGRIDTISTQNYTMHQSTPSILLYDMMQKDPELSEVFVIDDTSRVLGMLTRSYLLEKFGGQYGYNLNRKRSVGDIMQTDFMAVECDQSIDHVAQVAMDRDNSHIYDSIAVIHQGIYVGTVTVKALLLSAIQIQVKRATDINPLTGLPGNTSIQEKIAAIVYHVGQWAVIYIDLDNFKAYNDAYGFQNGDHMIKAVAEAIHSCCHPSDFVGHIGGDDFVIVTENTAPDCLCQRICQRFHNSIQNLYQPEDWNRGLIISKDRNGMTQEFPIVSLSIAIVTNVNHPYATADALLSVIASTKKICKQQKGDWIEMV